MNGAIVRCPRCHRRVAAGRACPEHGLAPAAAPRPRSAEPLPVPPPWRAVAGLAEGGSARVLEVVDDRDRRAALKLARWRDVDLRVRFAEEARLLAQVGPPAVPAVLDHGIHEGWPYLVVEHLGGPTLAAFIAEHGDRAPIGRVLAILRQLVDAVGALHRAGLVHCDLKPENVFLDGDRVRLIDLGVARRVRRSSDDGDGDTTSTEVGGGTVYYHAPEQLRGEPVDGRTDVYAIGVIAFELATGRPPFVGARAAIEYGHLLCRAPAVGSLRPDATALDALVADCLTKARERRPTLAELAARLAAPPRTTPVAPSAPAARRAEGEPVALLWIGSGALEVVRAIERTRGVVVGRRGAGVLAAYPCRDHDGPLRSALAAAATLDPATPVVAHVATATLRASSRGRVAVHGAAVAEPLGWLPRDPWTGAVLTTAAARELPDEPLQPATDARGFHRRGERAAFDEVPTLVGRRAVIDTAAAELAAAARGAGPRLVTVVGEPGIGKTRVLAELRRALGDAAPIVALEGRRRLGGETGLAGALAGALGGGPLDAALARHAARGVVALVDDAQWVDDEILDALETATGWATARIGVAVAATPELTAGRPRWGERAAAHTMFALPPLGADEAIALLRALLAPATHVPHALLERLAERGAGNPGVLVGIVAELRRQGIVRRHPDSDEWYVAADQLDLVPLRGSARWIYAQRLIALPPDIRALLERCAVVGPRFDLRELEAIQPAAAAGGAIEIDPAAGLDWLVRAGLVRGDGDGWHALASAALHEIAYERVDDDRRRALHAAAFEHWRDRVDATAEERLCRLAHHGAATGEITTAAAAYLALARAARREHRHLEVERLTSRVVELLDGADDLRVVDALAERGRARRMLTHYEAALTDLARARALAERLDDRARIVDLLAAEAAVLDFTDRLAESAARIDDAHARAPADLPVDVRARLLNWTGVVRVRQGRLDEAVRALDEAIALATALDDRETVTGSMLMLAGALRRLGRVDEGLAILARAIDHCEAAGDPFHLVVALFNRINGWRRLGRTADAEADCRRAIAVAERHGLGHLEVWGWHNLAELRWGAGDLAGALEASRRAHALGQRRFRERAQAHVTVQLGVLAAGLGDRALAADLLGALAPEDTRSSASLALLADATAAALADAPAARWEPLVARALAPGAEEDALLVLWLRASAAARGGRADELAGAIALAAREAARAQLAWPGPFAAYAAGPAITP